jgi:hypothetical protein
MEAMRATPEGRDPFNEQLPGICWLLAWLDRSLTRAPQKRRSPAHAGGAAFTP